MLESQLVCDEINQWHTLNWSLPKPFTVLWQITDAHIDHYNHVNNAAYVTQIEKVAWGHSNSIGLTIKEYKALDRAMVIRHHDLNYIHACYLDEQIACATWIVFCDKKLRLRRQFQFISTRTRKTVFTATTDFVCISLSLGSPKLMPPSFSETYSNNVTTLSVS